MLMKTGLVFSFL